MATSCSLRSTASQMPCQRSATSGEASGSPTKVSRRTPLVEQVVGERDGAGAVLGVDRVEVADRRPGDQDELGAAGGERLDDVVGDGAAEDDQPVAAPGHVADGGLGVVAAVGGQDQHRPAQLGGDRLRSRARPRRSRGRTGRGRRCRWRRAGARRAAGRAGWACTARSAAAAITRLAGVGPHVLRVAHDPGDGGDRDAGLTRDVADRGWHPIALLVGGPAGDLGCRRPTPPEIAVTGY